MNILVGQWTRFFVVPEDSLLEHEIEEAQLLRSEHTQADSGKLARPRTSSRSCAF